MHKTFTFMLLGALLLAAVLPSCQPAQSKPVAEPAFERVMERRSIRCGYLLWPLLTEKDVNTGKMFGYSVEIFEVLAARLGMKVEWVEEIAWGQQVAALETGRIDAICSGDGPLVYGMVPYVAYTRPFAYSGFFAYGRNNDTRAFTPATLSDASIILATLDGDISLTTAQDLFPSAKRRELPQLTDPAMLIQEVVNKRADDTLIDPGMAALFEKSNPGQLRLLFAEPVASAMTAFTVLPTETRLLNMINNGLSIVIDSGIVDKILDLYDPNHTIILRLRTGWQEAASIYSLSRTCS